MKNSKQFLRLAKEVNNYLDSLKYEELVMVRDIWSKVHDDLSRITIQVYEEMNPLNHIELGVRKIPNKVEVTGYIKIDEEPRLTFLHIEKLYALNQEE